MTNDVYIQPPDDWWEYEHSNFSSLEKGLEDVMKQIPKEKLQKIAKKIEKDKERGGFGEFKSERKKKQPWNTPLKKIVTLEELDNAEMI